MNSLSWFLYLADVVGNIATLFGIFAFLGIPAGILAFLIGQFDDDLPQASTLRKAGAWVFSVAIVLATFSALTPSKETIYLIAGSEAGEMVIQTPEAQQIMSDVHEVIRLQLQELKGEGK